MTDNTQGHEVTFEDESGWYRARCSCGWRTFTAKAWATRKRAEKHLAQVSK